MEADLDVVFAGALDGLLELDGVAIDGDAFVLELAVDVHGGDGPEGLAALAGFEGETEAGLVDLGGEGGGVGDFLGFALGASGGEGLKLAEVAFGGFVGLALRDEEVASEAGFDFHDVGFGAEAVNFLAEDDFCSSHGRKRGPLKGAR